MLRWRLTGMAGLVVFLVVAALGAYAEDWPMWRFDAGRTAASPETLPDDLDVLWVRHFTPRRTAWQEPLNVERMPYDRCFEPVVTGNTMFVPFNDSDKLLAVDTDTGLTRWVFYTDGPVRLPPVATTDTVFFASDDGHLYCLDAATGEMRWRFRGGPADRRILGNERLVSTWPVRGGPVLKDDVVYFAASIWPMMGTFIYALDARTGDVVWRNDRTGADWINQPHRNPAFAGVAPQGALVATDDRLLIPGGRSVPACFDRHTGEYLYYRLDEDETHYGKTGGSFVCAGSGVFFNRHMGRTTTMYGIDDGVQRVAYVGDRPVLTETVFYASGPSVTAFRAENAIQASGTLDEAKLWEVEVDASADLIKAGDRLYAAGAEGITAIDLAADGSPKEAWSEQVEGGVERLLAAAGKLFAVTLDGRIMAFGERAGRPAHIKERPEKVDPSPRARATASDILAETGVDEGYALVYGVGKGRFLEALAASSDLAIIAVDPSVKKVEAARKRLDESGLYGTRVAVHEGDPLTFDSPPYMASLSVVDLDAARFAPTDEFLNRVFRPMRPYGGKLWLPLTGSRRDKFLGLVERSGLPGATAVVTKNGVVLSREGPLPGAGVWTHQYGDAANTAKSNDTLVRMPLGVLWFGGNNNEDVLPRHGHGPPEQVIGGRLFLEGMDQISARDVYTGRVLWKTRLGDLGTYDIYYDKTYPFQQHIPGANARGTNFVATADAVYVVQGAVCHVLDAATGERLREIALPGEQGGPVPEWGYIAIHADSILAGCNFAKFSDYLTEEERQPPGEKPKRWPFFRFDKTASRQLVVMDKQTGAVRWSMDARYGFIHNAIAIAGDTLFCLDKLPPYVEQAMARRAEPVPEAYRLLALDLRTGDTRWTTKENVFGTWLSYSEEHGVLLQATRPSGDMVRGEDGKRMIAYQAADGTVLWDVVRDYFNPPILHGDKIITHSRMYNLLTGEPILRTNPLTGESTPWTYERTKGCGYHIASEHLITFRSSAAAYYDLEADGGTGHFGGFKSGCTANLIAADGILNAPDYTRTCTCSYQNQTSLALIHMPDVEVWTTFPEVAADAPIQRIGINLGASGDRRADDGTLWLEYPVVGGDSPAVGITAEPGTSGWFQHHASFIEGGDLPWVGSSGADGLTALTVILRSPQARDERSYTVRLHFAEPEDRAPGERLFSVHLQGREVLPDFDIVEAAGGVRRTVVREFTDISVQDVLDIRLAADKIDGPGPVLCGVEAIADGAG